MVEPNEFQRLSSKGFLTLLEASSDEPALGRRLSSPTQYNLAAVGSYLLPDQAVP